MPGKGASITGLTEALAEFIQVKTLKDVPPEALDQAKKAQTRIEPGKAQRPLSILPLVHGERRNI